jgi:hypothetical protein
MNDRIIRRDKFTCGDAVIVKIAGQPTKAIVVRIEGNSAIVCARGEGVNDRRYDLSEIRHSTN